MSEASSLTVSAKPLRREHVPLGILYMVSATIVFAVSSAVSKWLVASYPVGEVLFTRTSVALLTCALFILPHTGLAVFRTQRLRHHVLRSVSQGCSQTFLLIAFSLMPLAGATAINFSSPLFATLASALLLKETVWRAGWRCWWALAACSSSPHRERGRTRSARCSRWRTPSFTGRSPRACAE